MQIDLKFVLYVYVLIINIVAFVQILVDKRKAINNQERTPEAHFFFYSALFGSAGVLLGMLIYRHKTRKWYFVIGIPLIFLQNIFSAMLIYYGLLSQVY